jgi:PilZ domain
MPGKLLDRILFTCKHEFSWPRRNEQGDYYQVCLHCGVQYRYDWARMRRLDKMQAEAEPTPLPAPGRRPAHRHDVRTTWHPRERRLKWAVEMQYRVKGTQEWHDGTSENISRSGMLFIAAEMIEAGTQLEIALEMPVEIVGVAGTRVICEANIARCEKSPEENSDKFRVATRISGYQLARHRVAG